MRYVLLLCLCTVLPAQNTDLAKALEAPRQRINTIDDQIVKLLNERAQVVRDVGSIKQQFHAPASAPGREEQVLRRVAAEAQSPLAPSNVEAIYQAILREMSAMEAAEMEKSSKSR
jgi:chorismate mutase/prephenate dehydratase